MAVTTLEAAKISIKIMLQKGKNKVIFAEADNHFVDILFSFMTLPLGTIVRILEGCPDEKDVALGGIKNLYQSLKDLPAYYFSTDESKYILMNPRISSTYDLCRILKLNIDDTEPSKYYICRSSDCTPCGGEYSLFQYSKCGTCGKIMDVEVNFENSTDNTGGDQVNSGVFVSEATTFIVTDDLRVMPNTFDSVVQLLRDHGITDTSQLKERIIDVGREQILMILKGALLSGFSLTYLIFLETQLELVGSLVDHGVMKNEVGTNTKRIMLKVTLQKSTSKFLFAEADEDFVDFVFGFLGIPLGVVIGKLLDGTTSIGSLDNLFASICSIGEGKYIQSQDVVDMLREPQVFATCTSRNQIFPLNVSNASSFYFYHYWGSSGYGMYISRSLSYDYRSNETMSLLYLKDPRIEGSFMKSPAKFMLTDDLCVTPLSSFSTIDLLNELNVPLDDVENHELSIGIEQGLKLLKASLMSSGKYMSPLVSSLIT